MGSHHDRNKNTHGLVKAAQHVHAERSLDPFQSGHEYRLHGQNDKAGQAEAPSYFVDQEVRTLNTECCYQQQGGYDNSYIDSYQNRPVQHYYSSPYACSLLQSKINSTLQSHSILTTFISAAISYRMAAHFSAFIYSWALYSNGNRKRTHIRGPNFNIQTYYV